MRLTLWRTFREKIMKSAQKEALLLGVPKKKKSLMKQNQHLKLRTTKTMTEHTLAHTLKQQNQTREIITSSYLKIKSLSTMSPL
jgi:hypothetical protein